MKDMKVLFSKVKSLVVITIIIVLCVVVYYFYINGDKEEDAQGTVTDELSEVEKILTKNIPGNPMADVNVKEDYPETPREVVKFFTRIQKCYYNLDNTELVVEQLADMSRLLFDEALLEKNPVEDYYKKLKDEIEEYKKNKRTIEKVIVDESSDIVYGEVNGQKTAELKCTYYIQSGNHLTSTTEIYVLRKDAEGNWKIYGWQLDEPSKWEK